MKNKVIINSPEGFYSTNFTTGDLADGTVTVHTLVTTDVTSHIISGDVATT